MTRNCFTQRNVFEIKHLILTALLKHSYLFTNVKIDEFIDIEYTCMLIY